MKCQAHNPRHLATGVQRALVGWFLGCLLVPSGTALAQDAADPGLLAVIQRIKAVDNHAHALPARAPSPGEADRPNPLGKTPFEYPVRLRVTNPEYLEAWRALYGYTHQDMTADHAREALKAKLRLMEEKGTDYPSWVMDQAGVEVMLVNMSGLGPGQNGPRFRWVPRADGFLYPFASDDGRIQSFRNEIGLDNPPTSLNEYVAHMRMRLEKWQKVGAAAIKLATAYARRLDFALVSDAEASRVFKDHLLDGKPSAKDAKTLEDFLVRSLAREAGHLGLVVQIHTGIGAEPYFNVSGSNPMLLETMFNDPALRQTRFVMVHGGWPFEREAGVMLIKPNVYADCSAQTFLRSTEALSDTLRAWLEWYPERVLFGTDSYPDDTPLANWEEKLWLSTRTARQALALALTRMMKAGQVTRPRAEQLARMVLRDNAMNLYGLVGR